MHTYIHIHTYIHMYVYTYIHMYVYNLCLGTTDITIV